MTILIFAHNFHLFKIAIDLTNDDQFRHIEYLCHEKAQCSGVFGIHWAKILRTPGRIGVVGVSIDFHFVIVAGVNGHTGGWM